MKNFTVCKMSRLHRKPEKAWDKKLYLAAVKTFLNTNQDIPFCCCISKEGKHDYAKIKVVTNINNANRGRPFFTCSKVTDPCNYFAWGDEEILETPLCKHLQPSRMFTVKKEGLNKGRRFFRCSEQDVRKRCKFFMWSEDVNEELEKGLRCPLNSSTDESKTEREEKLAKQHEIIGLTDSEWIDLLDLQ